ncbi:MAG: sodium/proton-translocating pyrophosphatase [Armatimonadetes bacterium]|nr:sodium/proton-translocating pyrophosphatase [Armatimonadota bacterium]
MMGGMSEQSKIYSHEFVSREEAEFQQRKAILDVRDRLAKTKKVEKDQVTSDDVAKDPEITKLIADEQERTGAVSSALTMPESMVKKPEPMHGYVPFDAKDKNSKVGQYATQFVPMDKAVNADPSKAPEPIVDTIANRIASGGDLRVFTVNVTMTPTAQPGQPKPEERTNKVYIGPVSRTDLDAVIKNATKNPGSPKIQVEGEGRKVEFFTNDEGKLIAAVDDPKNEVKIERVQPIQPLTFFKADVKRVNEALAKQKANPNQMAAMPASDSVTTVRLVKKLVPWWTFVACILFGIAMAYLFERLTDYYVSLDRKPVKEVAQVATAGPAPMIIQGFALASESSFFNAIAIVLCLMAPMMIFPVALYGNFILSFYGIALVGLGLLTTTGYILAMDTFGPISDNAQGVFEMSGAGHDNPVASKGIQRLDAAGNTTKALTKGFAIATAVVAATALFHSFVEAAKLESVGMRIDVPQIFLGFIVGGAAPYLFSAFSINAVGRAAFQLINEVRSQFRNDPGIMAGTSKPNYGKCVEIVTTAAQRELAGPGILAIALPIAVAYGFSIGNTPVEINGVAYNLTGAQALGGFLAGCILSGQLLAVLLANSGGIWDNAKKLIEDGLHGGKGTEAHKAGVVCDTVGDPFKDTAGPALNPLIKVMNLIALLLAPVIIMPVPVAVSAGVTAVAVIALGYAVWYSKRGSFGSEMAAASGPDAIPEQSSAAPKPVQKPASDETKSE